MYQLFYSKQAEKFLGRQPKAVAQKILDKLDSLFKIHLSGQGEPFLNPDIFKMIEYANKKGIIVYPNNISDKIQLYVTVFHELTHIIQKWQGKSFLLDVPVWAKYGEEPCEIEAENAGEKAAEILMGLRQYKEYKRRQKEAGKGPRDFS